MCYKLWLPTERKKKLYTHFCLFLPSKVNKLDTFWRILCQQLKITFAFSRIVFCPFWTGHLFAFVWLQLWVWQPWQVQSSSPVKTNPKSKSLRPFAASVVARLDWKLFCQKLRILIISCRSALMSGVLSCRVSSSSILMFALTSSSVRWTGTER